MKRFLILIWVCMTGFSCLIYAQDFSISIDAEKDAFYDGLTGQADGLVFMPSRCYLPDIGSGPDDDNDISAIVWMSYDAEYIYCYVEVTDDIVKVDNSSRWLNDCIELKFDPDPDFFSTGETSNMRLSALGADDAEQPSAVDNLNASQHLIDLAGQPYEPVEEDYARRLTATGYVLEFRVPIAYINTTDGRSLELNEIGKFGMAINIADNDVGDRENMLQWSAGHADAAHSNSSLLGTVTFLEDNKLQLEAVSYVNLEIVNENAEDWYSNPNPVGVRHAVSAISYELPRNYPNPFNPQTQIAYSVQFNSFVSLSVYDAMGHSLQSLVSEIQPAGRYIVRWDGKDFLGRPVPSGMYIYRLQVGERLMSGCMLKIR